MFSIRIVIARGTRASFSHASTKQAKVVRTLSDFFNSYIQIMFVLCAIASVYITSVGEYHIIFNGTLVTYCIMSQKISVSIYHSNMKISDTNMFKYNYRKSVVFPFRQ
jgi:hypothetical protein